MLIEDLHLCLIFIQTFFRLFYLRVPIQDTYNIKSLECIQKNPKMETNTVIEIYVHISTEICYRFSQHNHLFTFLTRAFEI